LADPRLARRTLLSSFVAVPLLLAALTALQTGVHSRETQFLILPPFAVLIYLLFREPYGPGANIRSIVLLPCASAAVGELSYRYLGFTPVGVAVCALAVLAVQELLRTQMPPALALSVLAMLLRATQLTYLLGVAEASVFIALVFFLWRRVFIAPLRVRQRPR
jgi:HPP family protein